MVKVTNWDKFKLLLWKNWTIKWNRKWELAIELLVPIIASLILVILRALAISKPHTTKTDYPPLDISNLGLLLQSLGPLSLQKPPEVKLLYSPNTSVDLDRIMQAATRTLFIFQIQGYANAKDLEYALITGNYLAGVQFNNIEDYPRKLSFALRFPCELRTAKKPLTWLTTRLFPKFIVNRPRNHEDKDGGMPVGYLREGFIPIQHAISMTYIKQASNQEIIPEIQMQRYPYPAFIFDLLMEELLYLMGQFMMLSYLLSAIIITKNICMEKEKMLKEVMKIIGLQNWLHWTAWFVQSFIMLTISSILITTILKIKWSNDMAVLPYSNYTALLFFLLIYSLTCICWCFMIASFFSKASTAAGITGLIMILTYFPFDSMQKFYDDMTVGQKLGWCFALNTAMTLGFNVIIRFEGTGEGLQWSNICSPVSVDDGLTLGAIMLVMLATWLPLILLCLYIEQIYPGKFGVAREWNFPFTSQFWGGKTEYIGVKDKPNEKVQPRNPDAFEAEPVGKGMCVQVKSLGKRFDDKIAVQGLSLNMYEDEITVLLGHNGSGKTTTLSMLAGMYPPTSGTAIINGSDIRTNIEGARMSLGFCPEHNVLFDDLSVSDHIVFFSRVKGLKGEALEKEVDAYLKIGLSDKANISVSKLSGGMKRKLSLCCALCGDTKVLLCDEPTSGMDPAARRQLWDLFHSKKVGRTFLITTHFMDEADILGDRIAIMCEGELKCHGSSFFLKKKYGSGYNLVCVKLENCKSNEVTALLGNYIPGIKPKSDIGAELSYEVPDKYTSVFEDMFRSLEKNSERLNLDGYGISITSIEEVFMKVGAENANAETSKEQNAIMKGTPEDDFESIQSKRTFTGNSRPLKGTDLFLNQWHAMFLKKFLYTFRNKVLFFLMTIFPMGLVIIVLIINKIDRDKDLPPLTMKLTQYPDVVTILEKDSSLNNLAADAVEVQIANYYEALANAGPDYTFQSTGTSSFTDYIIDLGKSIQVRIDSSYLVAATVARGKITAWLNNQPLHTAPLTVNLVHNAIAKALIGPDAEITITNAPLPFSADSILNTLLANNLGGDLCASITFSLCFVTAFYIFILIKERDCRWKLIQFVGGVKVWAFWLPQFIWDMATFTIIALAIIIAIAFFQAKGLSQFSQLGPYFFTLIVYGFSTLTLTYLLSFLFSKPGTGFACVAIVNLFISIGGGTMIAILSNENFGTKKIADTLPWFFRLCPLYCLRVCLFALYFNTASREACNDAFILIQSDEIFCQLMPKCCNPTPFFAWEEPGVLTEVVYMAASGVIYFSIVIMIDYDLLNKIINKFRQLKK